MKLLTKTIEKRFQKIGKQEDVKDPIVVAKFFNPCGAGTWYATEYNPEGKMFFGYVSIFGDSCDEWGYFSLTELETIKTPPFGLGIERDLHCGEKRISEFNIPSLKGNMQGDWPNFGDDSSFTPGPDESTLVKTDNGFPPDSNNPADPIHY